MLPRSVPLLALAALLAGCPSATSTKAPKETVVRAPNQGTTAAPPVSVPTLTRDPNVPTLPSDAADLFPTKPEQPAPAAPAPTVTTLAGSGVAGYRDAMGQQAQFKTMNGLAIDAQGNLYVADTGNNRIRKIDMSDPANPNVSNLAGVVGPGGLQNVATGAGSLPSGIAYDGKGGLFIADAQDNHVRRLDLASGQLTVLAGSADFNVHDGQGAAASFNSPQGVACDDQGNAYVADAGNRRVRKVTPDGTVTSLQLGPVGGNVPFQPGGLAWLAGGTLVVADLGNSRVLAVPPAVGKDAPATTMLADGFATPQGLAVAADGTIYLADTGHHEIRKLVGGVKAKSYARP